MATQIEAGKYEGRIINYDITETKGGDPQVAILFEFRGGDGNRRELTWFGNLTHEKGKPITLKALVTCGFTGRNLSELSGGIVDGKAVLSLDTPVELDIELETRGDKTYPRIKWINRIGRQNKWVKPMGRDQARAKLAGMGLEGELAQIRAEQGAPRKPSKEPEVQDVEPGSFDDLPF